MRAVIALAAACLAACAAQSELRLAPSTDGGSAPFESTMAPGSRNAELAALHGYVEEEFFLSGRANVYRHGADGRAEAETADVPYTTRLLIARPREAAAFSGRAYLVPMHPSRGQTFWPSIRDHAMRNGDVYVGVFIGTDERSRAATQAEGRPADALSLMRAHGADRYGQINWPRDDGIRWDVFGQTAQLVRSDARANPLRAFEVSRLYAVGWSFTGSFLRTYINEGFHDRYRLPTGALAIDGYLIGISQRDFRSGYLTINSRAPEPPENDPHRAPRAIDAPVIELMTENEAVTKAAAPLPEEGDAGPLRLRTYEVPGVTHGDGLSDGAAPSQCPYPESDVPFRMLAWAALANLDTWARDGIAPPRQERPMQTDPSARVAVKDALGNAVGGVAVPQIALPLARYGAVDDPRCAPRAPYYLAMRRVPLDPAQLAALYPGGEAEYLARFEAHLDGMIAARWFLAEDKAALMAQAREAAEAAFP